MGTINCVGTLYAKAGSEEALASLLNEFVDTVQAGDPGTLAFGFFEGDAPGSYYAVEIYKSSEDALGHLANVGPLFPRLSELLDPDKYEQLQVFGDPSPALREQYDAFDAVYRAPYRAF